MNPFRLPGLTAAPFSPFRSDGSLNLDPVPAQAASLRASGVIGAFVCGTTGEGASLTTREREALADAWVRAAGGLRIVVNVSAASGREAQRLAEHAARAGADAISCTAPFYFRPAGVKELVTFLADVAAGAPATPFYFYDIPSTTGVLFPCGEVMRKCAEAIPNLAGVKFSNPDLHALQECVAVGGDVLFGIDEYLLAALALGATGAVGSTYNLAAPLFLKMWQEYRAGDVVAARLTQAHAARFIRILIDFGGIRAGKSAMRLLNIELGAVRSPLRPILAEEERTLHARLRAEAPALFTSAASSPSA